MTSSAAKRALRVCAVIRRRAAPAQDISWRRVSCAETGETSARLLILGRRELGSRRCFFHFLGTDAILVSVGFEIWPTDVSCRRW